MKMKETEYLLSVLEGWSKRFSGIHIRYAYDAAAEYHVVEIDPENIRRGDEDYKAEELRLYINFMSHFPQSCLLIAKPCESYNMTNVLYENERHYVNCLSAQTCELMNYQPQWRNVNIANMSFNVAYPCISNDKNVALAA